FTGNHGQIEPCLRASQGDVEDALTFFVRFGGSSSFCIIVVSEVEHALAAGIMKFMPLAPALEEKPAVNEDDRRFEALTLMDRHALDGVAVGFQPLDIAVLAGWLASSLNISGQSRDQVGQRASGAASFFEQDLAEVEVIGECPLVVLLEELTADDAALFEDP